MTSKFTAILWKYPGKGGWTFVTLPEEMIPPVTAAFGRTPVLAEVDGRQWETSVWRDKTHGALLPVPAKIRRGKKEGDRVEVRLSPRAPQ